MIKNPWIFPGIMGIDDAVSHVWGITPEMLKQRARKREVVEPRQVAIWWRIRNTSESLNRIGGYYGLDHATALHARNQVMNLMKYDRSFQTMVDQVEKMMISKYR